MVGTSRSGSELVPNRYPLWLQSFFLATVPLAAVTAALSLPWSNGQTEGQITKLKLVKRQMYGRGKIDMLQARVACAV